MDRALLLFAIVTLLQNITSCVLVVLLLELWPNYTKLPNLVTCSVESFVLLLERVGGEHIAAAANTQLMSQGQVAPRSIIYLTMCSSSHLCNNTAATIVDLLYEARTTYYAVYRLGPSRALTRELFRTRSKSHTSVLNKKKISTRLLATSMAFIYYIFD